MNNKQIRPIAICIIRREDKAILVMEWHDQVEQQTFYRPLGGGIEFGELSSQALLREIQEEIGVEVVNLRFLQMLENIFTYERELCHEVVFVYQGEFADKSLYSKSSFIGREVDGKEFKVVWKQISAFREGQAPLYPDGILALLATN